MARNKVTAFSQDPKINTTGSTFSSEFGDSTD